jgi:hypothetical protein
LGWCICSVHIRGSENCILHLLCRRLQEERQYKPGWCYRMLRSRWGEPTLKEFQIKVET